MSVHLFTVTIQSATGLPQDDMVNTFHFEGSGVDPDNVVDLLDDFYTAVPATFSGGIEDLFSSQAVGTEMTIRGYDLSDPKPRAPVIEEVRGLSPSTGTALPTECALCLSYSAALTSGVPPARRRGRIYLGGFLAALNTTGGRPSAALINNVVASARDLLVASNSAVNWQWVQYSQTLAAGENVVNGWMDDAWDTQRRRGIDASSRTTWSATTP